MQISLSYVAGWFLIINLVAAIVTFADKRYAIRRRRRVPERRLIGIGALGGAAGMLATMLLIRHKTRHPKFMIGLPLLLIAQMALLWWLWKQNILYVPENLY